MFVMQVSVRAFNKVRMPIVLVGGLLFLSSTSAVLRAAGELHGTVVDADIGTKLAARIYLRSADKQDLHVQAVEGGNAIPYAVRRSPDSFEVHTSVTADGFVATLPAGKYWLAAEHGKEYVRRELEFEITDEQVTNVAVPLQRWIDMPKLGWYSGETHSHRAVKDTPTLQLSEDLHVSFPLTAWVTDTRQTPATNSKLREALPEPAVVEIDPTHVYWPINTEYELFTVAGRSHTLGAFFVLGHREPIALAAPPVGPIANVARQQGGFLEFDKHNWPWSMMIVPQMKIDLFELTNNHVWQTKFLFKEWYPEYVADFMKIEMQDGGFTERGWLEFGFRTYYALLNCGFDMKPTAGTASGVHPVPLGFGRAYVRVDGAFSYHKWRDGLLSGDSFVTTGPMLMTQVTELADERIQFRGTVEASTAPTLVEIIVNGEVVQSLHPTVEQTTTSGFRCILHETLVIAETSWVAVRAWTETADGRQRFAHSAPQHIKRSGSVLRPTVAERDYLLKRVVDELSRHQGVLPQEALAEYEAAAEIYRSLDPR